MEAADDAATGVAPLGGLVVSGEDGFTRTTGGVEESRLGRREEIQIAEGGHLRWGISAKPLAQLCRKTWIVTRDVFQLQAHGRAWVFAQSKFGIARSMNSSNSGTVKAMSP